jgi:Na+-translocating ferredoxin:NAD+ oxidoreductase RnfG subunit
MPELRAVLNVAAIALVCAVALTATHRLTGDRIRVNENAQLRAVIAGLLPAGEVHTSLPAGFGRSAGAWRLCSGHLLGRSNTTGYGGDIRLLYTLSDSTPRSLIALAVLGHQETPGIADFLTDPDWLATFRNRTADDIEGMAAITGATITSRAVTGHLIAVLRDSSGTLGEADVLACGS